MDGGAQCLGTQKVRVVADLTLPEALMIWALRKHHLAIRGHDACDPEVENASDPIRESLDNLAITFNKVFGSAKLSEAVETFGLLVAALESGARCPLRINAYDEECLSLHEEHFLSILAAFQQAEIERAAMLVQWLINGRVNQTFTRSTRSFADLLLKSGHSMTGKIMQAPQDASQTSTDRGEALAPRVEKTAELTLGEAVILQGTRRWVACLHQEQEPFPALRAHFAHYGIADCAEGLNAVLRNIAFAASRSVDVRGQACPGLSPDEADLLHAVAGFQRGDSAPAYDALVNWLPLSAIRLSVTALSDLAEKLRAAGLILPLRAGSQLHQPQVHHPRSWRSKGPETTGRTYH